MIGRIGKLDEVDCHYQGMQLIRGKFIYNKVKAGASLFVKIQQGGKL